MKRLTGWAWMIGVLAVLGGCAHVEADRAPAMGRKRQQQSEPTTQTEPAPWGAQEEAGHLRRKFQGLYVNGVETPTFDFIRRARETIDIEIYEMGDPDIRAALRTALSEKVQIRVVKDPTPLGASCKYFELVAEKDNDDCRDQKKLVAEIQASPGGAFVPFVKSELCATPGKSCFQHGKMILIDARTQRRAALLSTGNFNSSNLCNLARKPSTCNRDYSYITADREVVDTLLAVFEKDVEGKRYDVASLLPERLDWKLTVSPHSLSPIVDFIRSAKRTIEIENQYLKVPEINEALLAMANTGVKVQVTLASLCAFGKPSASAARQATETFTKFDEAGISTRMFTSMTKVKGKPGYMHAKAIVVDGRDAWMGSVNGSSTSTSQNREYGIFFRSASAVSHLRKTMRDDHADPGTESWRESLDCVKD